MTKGQSLIIEFVLFFLISFSLFAVISSFFYNQNEFFKSTIGKKLTDIINNFFSSHIIKGNGCKMCDSIEIKGEIPSKVGGYYYRVFLNGNGLNTTLLGNIYSRESSIFNLNKTFTFEDSQSKSENKIIGIQINNINKKIVIG